MGMVNWFFDNNGNFLWASITAIAAVAAFVINSRIANKTAKANFEANIVAKSRIEWIQEVRKKSAEFIASCYDLLEFLELQKNEDSESNNENSEEKKARLKNEVQKNGTLLTLYFGPDSSKNNDLITLMIKDLVKKLTNKEGFSSSHSTLIEDQLFMLKDFLRIYFKAEWKRANGELSDSKVQEYLEGIYVYRRIVNNLSIRLEDDEEKNKRYYESMREYIEL